MGIKIFFFYMLYAVAAFLLFLLLLFPGKRMAQYLSRQINAEFQYGEISIDNIGLSFPPLGVKTSRIEVLLKDQVLKNRSGVNQSKKVNQSRKANQSGKVDQNGKATQNRKPLSQADQNGKIAQSGKPLSQTLNINSLYIYPRIFTLYKNDRYLDFKALAYKGIATGSLQLQSLSLLAPPSYISVNMNLSDMEVSELKHQMEEFDIYLSFKINGDIMYSGFVQKMDESIGVADMILSQCVVRSDNVFLKQMGISELTFTTIEIELKKEKSVVNIQLFDASGPEMKITLKGSIILKNPVQTSILKISGDFQPDSSKISSLSGLSALSMLFTGSGKGIPFKITGTLKEPRAHF